MLDANATLAVSSRTLFKRGPSINAKRLYEALRNLGEIVVTPTMKAVFKGVPARPRPADGEGRRLVVAWMRDLGLEVTIDRIGNVFARREGRRNDLEPVMIGSHIDSVPTAGRFDGCLGVLGGLEIVRVLNEQKIQTDRPIVVAFFTDEEGCHLAPTCSAALWQPTFASTMLMR